MSNPRIGAAAAALLLLNMTIPALAGSPLAFERGKDQLIITIDGKPFARYVWADAEIQRPYFTAVHAPNGVEITRSLPPVMGKDSTDHATMHPGLWMAFGDISGLDFWRNKAVVRHAGFVDEPVSDSNGGRFSVKNLYIFGGKTLCEEVCRIQIGLTPQGYLIDWQSTFKGSESFTFGDQEEMGLGLRMATNLIVKNGGAITSGDGRKNEKQVWGKQANWCDYSGKGGGILLMPDPANFRRSWFHARDYGLLVANPFGRQAFTRAEPSRVVVAKGQSLTLRFGVLVHNGKTDQAAAYQDFLNHGRDRKPDDNLPATTRQKPASER